MDAVFDCFDVLEVRGLEAFFDLDREAFTAAFRGDRPVLIVCPFRLGPWVALVRAAPIDHALLAVDSPNFWFYGATSTWADEQLANVTVRRQFFREIEGAGFALDGVPRGLADNVSGCGGVYYRGRSVDLSGSATSLGLYRVRGDIWPAEILNNLIDYYNARLKESGVMAFCGAKEGDEESAPEHPGLRPWFPPDYSLLFAHPLPADRVRLPFDLSPEQRLVWLEEVKVRLEMITDRCESNNEWFHSMHYCDYIKLVTSFPVDYLLSRGEELDLQVVQLRSNLVRLLKWPQMYWGIVRTTERLRMMLSRTRAESAEPGARRIAACERVLDDLFHYIQEMRLKYPLLTANRAPDWLMGRLQEGTHWRRVHDSADRA